MDSGMRSESFVVRRGLAFDDRGLDTKPRSPVSYCAQYGVPLEDCERYVQDCTTHGQVLITIGRMHLADEKFREASMDLQVRPYS